MGREETKLKGECERKNNRIKAKMRQKKDEASLKETMTRNI
jgi:hypothetical protein